MTEDQKELLEELKQETAEEKLERLSMTTKSILLGHVPDLKNGLGQPVTVESRYFIGWNIGKKYTPTQIRELRKQRGVGPAKKVRIPVDKTWYSDENGFIEIEDDNKWNPQKYKFQVGTGKAIRKVTSYVTEANGELPDVWATKYHLMSNENRPDPKEFKVYDILPPSAFLWSEMEKILTNN